MKKPSKELTDLTLFLRSLNRCVIQEYQFHKPRRWKFDFAFIDEMVAIEYEGGVFRPLMCYKCRNGKIRCNRCGGPIHGTGGFHQSPKIMLSNMEKYNTASVDGWRLIRVCPPMVRSGYAWTVVEQALGIEKKLAIIK